MAVQAVHKTASFFYPVVNCKWHINFFFHSKIQNFSAILACSIKMHLTKAFKSATGPVVLEIRSLHTTKQLRCVATLHPPAVHRNCNVTALRCRMEVKFILT